MCHLYVNSAGVPLSADYLAITACLGSVWVCVGVKIEDQDTHLYKQSEDVLSSLINFKYLLLG